MGLHKKPLCSHLLQTTLRARSGPVHHPKAKFYSLTLSCHPHKGHVQTLGSKYLRTIFINVRLTQCRSSKPRPKWMWRVSGRPSRRPQKSRKTGVSVVMTICRLSAFRTFFENSAKAARSQGLGRAIQGMPGPREGGASPPCGARRAPSGDRRCC